MIAKRTVKIVLCIAICFASAYSLLVFFQKADKKSCNGTIFVSHHRPFWTYESSIFKPIHVGKKTASLLLNMIGDDTGDHISEKNPFYCELTAMYWAWKNRKPQDFIGFFHYRRYLNTATIPSLPLYEIIAKSDLFSKKISETSFIEEKNLIELMQKYDILIPPYAHSEFSIEKQYCLSHRAEDWEILKKLLQEKYPEHLSVMYKVFAEHGGYPCNCFVMKDALFQEYAEWLFPLLFELEKRITIQKDDPIQRRVFGFIGERLFNLFLEIKKEQGIRVKKLSFTQISDS